MSNWQQSKYGGGYFLQLKLFRLSVFFDAARPKGTVDPNGDYKGVVSGQGFELKKNVEDFNDGKLRLMLNLRVRLKQDLETIEQELALLEKESTDG